MPLSAKGGGKSEKVEEWRGGGREILFVLSLITS